MTNWHTFDSTAVLEELRTTENGISEAEARRRLQATGYNELKEKKRVTLLTLFLGQFKSFLVLILVIAAGISYLIENIIDAVLIAVIIIINALFGFIQEFKAEKTLESLKKLSTSRAKVIRDGEERLIDSREIVPGDILVINEGDKIPADARIIEVANLKVDEASLTGESIPVSKFDKVLKEVPLPERKNMLYLGTIATYGRAKAVVVSTGMSTEIGKIATLIQTSEQETPLQAKINSFGKWLGVIAVIIAGVAALIGILKSYALTDMFLTSAALAVSAVPEGLPALLTITLAIGVQRMGRNKAIVRKLSAVETLGSTTIILADKTGTMTTNEMTVQKVHINNQEIDVSGVGFEPKGEFSIKGKPIDPIKDKELVNALTISALCNDAVLTKNEKWNIIGDPTEGALLVVAKKAGIDAKELGKKYPRVNEIPFSSERKMMSTVHKMGKGYFVYSKGAPEVILSKCTAVLRSSHVARLSEVQRSGILTSVKELADKGLRVLAVAYKETAEHHHENLEKDMIFVGLLGMIDPPRPEVKTAIKTCHDAGIKVIMITGDHKDTAVAVARHIGLLKDGKVLTGEELEKIPGDKLGKVIEEVEVYARVSPAHKSRIVKVLREKGHVVAVTGDGVNDAPALKDAHIGVAMGIKGTDVAKEASEIVLADDNFSTIVKAVEEGRGIYDNIRKFIRYILSANFDEIFVIAVAILLGLPLPFLPIQILWINLLTDSLPALALGFDTKSKDIMKRSPRNPKESVLHKMLPFVISAGVLAAIVSLGLFIFELKTSGSIDRARTIVFTTAIIFELLFVFNCRSEKNPIWKINPLSNKLLVLAVLLGILLQVAIVHLPFFNALFKTVPLGLYDWLLIGLLSSTGLFLVPKIFIR
ncbi:MAG: calcium-translocating P-type ATPase, SERCA-type [Candidatus Aenigmarchaeota archaeon]|nr:calcium-translocating P-type ATPase, SERCA-type [Candidatus Aenigmarchaeota archaeon]